MSATARAVSGAAVSWWASTTNRAVSVPGPTAVAALWRQHQRRALTVPASSMNTTSPGSGDDSPAPRPVKLSEPSANRTVRVPATAAASSAATGRRWRTATRFPKSASRLRDGTSPCLTRRRNRASAALRYWVGFTPNPANTRRQAASDGTSDSGAPSRSASVVCCWARNCSSRAGGEGPLRKPAASAAPARIVGNRAGTSGW